MHKVKDEPDPIARAFRKGAGEGLTEMAKLALKKPDPKSELQDFAQEVKELLDCYDLAHADPRSAEINYDLIGVDLAYRRRVVGKLVEEILAKPIPVDHAI